MTLTDGAAAEGHFTMWVRRIATVICCGLFVAAVRGQTRPTGTAAETGVLVGRTVDSAGAPIAGAVVTLNHSGPWISRTGADAPVRQVMTDEHGHFAFADLPVGQFWLDAKKDGHADGAYGRLQPSSGNDTIILQESGRRVDLTITLWKFAAVSGTVTDDMGVPIVGASVGAYRRAVHAGHVRLEQVGVRGGQTNDRGEYRLFGITPGEYAFILRTAAPAFVLPAAGAGSSSPRAFVYPQATYPSPSADGAVGVMRISAGQQLAAVDFRVAAVPAFRVRGGVRGGDGQRPSTVRLLPELTAGVAPEYSSSARTVTTRPDGSFVVEWVPVGQYELRVSSVPSQWVEPARQPQTVIQTTNGSITSWVNLSNQPEPPQPPRPVEPSWWAAMPLVVADADLDDVRIDVRPGVRLHGRLQFDGAAPLPGSDRSRPPLRISLEPADGSQSLESQLRVSVSNNTEFTATGVVPGRYVIHADSDAGWVLKSATMNGRDIASGAFDIGATDIDDVVLVFTDRITSITGRTIPENAASGAQVFLFPVDRRLWVDIGRLSRRIQRWSLTRDSGSFFFTAVLPGEYFLIATAADFEAVWPDPQLLTRLSLTAERVTLREGDRQTHELRVQVIR